MDKVDTFLMGACFSLLFVIVLILISPDWYKQGQIDALTGKVKYHLVIQDDSTKTWEPIEEK
jgi:hypothetical protein